MQQSEHDTQPIETGEGLTSSEPDSGSQQSAFERIQAMLPYATPDHCRGMQVDELLDCAVASMDLDSNRRHRIGDLVVGLTELGETVVPASTAPTLIQWKLLQLLPDTWGGISRMPLGAVLDLEGIGLTKVRTLLTFAARRVLDSSSIGLPDGVAAGDDDAEALHGAVSMIANWGAAHDLGVVDAILELATGSLTGPIEALEVLDEFEPAGPGLPQDPRSCAERVLDSLDDRHLPIVTARLLPTKASDRRTLEDLGQELGVSRERVRQIEQGLRAQLHAVADSVENRPLQEAALAVRSDIGAGCPVGFAPELMQPDDDSYVDELVAWLAGPYELDGNWFVRSGTSRARLVNAAFESVATNQIAETTALEDELALLGVAKAHTDELLNTVGFIRFHEDRAYVTPRTIAARAEMQLRLHGRPMTYQELFELNDEVENEQSFRNAISTSDELKRVAKSLIALAEWDAEEYPGVVPAMVGVIQASPQPVPVDELCAELNERFSIAPASVRIHASVNPLFISEGDTVRLRTYAEPYTPSTDLSRSRDCFFIEGRWALRVVVDHDVLRGSGRAIPEAFANYIGLQPFGQVQVDAPERYVHGRWTQYPALGSIRANVISLGLGAGDITFLRYLPSGEFEFRGVEAATTDEKGPEEKLRLLIGAADVNDRRSWQEAMTQALGIASSGAASVDRILDTLSARKQSDLSELIAAIEGLNLENAV